MAGSRLKRRAGAPTGRQAAQHARRLIEASLDPLVTISAEGKITDVNEAMVKVTGAPRAELIGTDFSNYFTDPTKAREGYQQVLANSHITDYPLTIRHRDGRLTDLLYNGSVYRDSRGKVLGVFAAGRDVTDRRRAEQEVRGLNAELERRVEERTAELQASNDAVLRETHERTIAEDALHASDERCRVMFEHAPVGIVLADLQGHIIDANPALEGLLGYGKAELSGMSFAKFTHPDDLRTEQRLTEELLTGKRQRYEVEKRYFRKDGQMIWVRLAGSVLRNRRGEPEYGLSVIQDITQRKRAEEALRESETRFRGIVETAGEGIATHEPDGTITYVNQRMADMLGCSPGEIIGRSSLDFLDDEQSQAAIQARESMKKKGSFSAERRLRRKDGSILWTLCNVAPRRDGDGNFLGYLAMHTDITERKRTEAALEAAHARLKTIMQTAQVAICVAQDAECRQVTGNDLAHELLGVAKDGNLSATPARSSPPAPYRVFHDGWEVAGDELPLQQAARTGQAVSGVELDLVRADGNRTTVLCSAAPLYDSAHAVNGVVGTLLDITARKRAEEELRDSEKRLALAASATGIGIFESNTLTGDIAGTEQFGYLVGLRTTTTATTTLSHHYHTDEWAERVHPDDWLGLRSKIDACRSQRLPLDAEYRVVGSDDTERWVNVRGVFQDDEQGNSTRFLGVLIDSTERKRSEEALRQRTEELQIILDTTPVAIFMAHDPECEKITGNSAAQKLVELPPEANFSKSAPAEERPTHWQEVRDGAAIAPDDLPLQRAAHGEEIRDYEMDLVFEDGTVKSVVGDATPIRDENGNPRGGVAILMDITERKRFEEQREALLASERAARTEAEHASHMKDEFIAVLSHELRNPLNAILGWVHILRRSRRLAEDIDEGLNVIETSGRTLTDMVTDLLDMSRITGGKLRLDVQTVDLGSVVKAAVETVRAAASAKGISLEVVCSDGIGAVRCDPGRLQQIIWNLVANAVKFTPHGGQVRVEVTKNDSTVTINVSDSGEGIDVEFLPHVFERFRQEDASMSRRHGGLGLGLSIVRSLVELHGGTVRAESAGKGHGATFTVTLPVQVDAGREHAKGGLPGGRYPASVPPADIMLDGIKLLVVDDEPDTLRLVKHMLEERFAQVFTAKSASEGMEMLQRVRPNVLISDIGMPEEDGLQFLHRVRALGPKSGGATPAVALTAYAGLEDCQRALACGYQAHLPKPIDVDQLLATVAGLVGRLARAPAQSSSDLGTPPSAG